jgi:thiol:disulfide interchange protein DsbG
MWCYAKATKSLPLRLANAFHQPQGTDLKTLLLALTAALTLALGACSQQASTDAVSTTKPAQPYEAVVAQGKGFTAGASMAANTVYVLFDPQCPHCGQLWHAAEPLLKTVKFVWIPVTIMGKKSIAQGAALLTAANPTELMTQHENSVLAGTGGISASSNVSDEVEQTLKNNTQLFNSLGVDSVPYILARNARTGKVVTHKGALGTAELADFLGVDQP